MSEFSEPWKIKPTYYRDQHVTRIVSGDREIVEHVYRGENAERIVRCVNFCSDISNEQLQEMNSLAFQQAEAEALGSLLLDVRDDNITQIRLLKELVYRMSRGDVIDYTSEFEYFYARVYDYLKEKDVIRG